MSPALALWAAVLSAAVPSQPSTELFAHPLTVDRLDNGLTLVTLQHESPGVVSFFTLVRAGSRDEVEPGKSGYAHLFEHLMFRGTEQMPAAQYERQMQAFGADNNAFTTSDFTLYQPTLPKESLPELVRIEADRFQHLSYAPGAYKDETGAVLGEYNKNASNPLLPMEEALRAIAFTVHPYGHTTLGFKRDVEAMPAAYDYSRAFFRRFYTPDDCTIFAIGDVDHDAVLELVRSAYSGWSGHRAPTAAKAEPPQIAPRARAVVWPGPTLPRILVGFKVPATSASLPDAAALAVVSTLAFGESSDLYQRMVVKEQRLIELESDTSDVFNRDPGLFTVSAKLKPETTFDTVTREIEATLARVAAGEVPAPKLEATRNHLIHALTLSLQTPQRIAITLAYWTAWTGDVRGLEAYRRALAAVTVEDVARVAKTYLVPSRRNTVTLTGPSASAPVKTARVP